MKIDVGNISNKNSLSMNQINEDLKRVDNLKAELIAPCGMTCNVYSNYLALINDTKAKV